MAREVTKSVLVVGGAGYIGSHTAKALAEQGFSPIVFDNLSSGRKAAVRWGPFVHGDVRDEAALRDAMSTYTVSAVIHFASLIEVGRSVVRPDLFYQQNLGGTAALLAAMRACGVPRLVFSSSAAVYGTSPGLSALETLDETLPKEPASPYGDTKLACERMIAAYARAFGLSAFALRYFNAAGADPSAVIGEAHEPETHLIPLAIEAALGVGPPLTLFGADFDTPDGSCVRDYVHVNDLATAHLAALQFPLPSGQFEAINVGTGVGKSVLQVIASVERETGRRVPYVLGPRRGGDPASLVANAKRIGATLRWGPQHSDLDTIVRDAVRWRRSPGFGFVEARSAA